MNSLQFNPMELVSLIYFTSSFLICLIFVFFFLGDRRDYLKFWAVSWGVFAVAYMLLYYFFLLQFPALLLYYALILVTGAYFFHRAALAFLDFQEPVFWKVAAALAFLLIIGSNFFEVSLIIWQLAVFGFSGLLYLNAGACFLKQKVGSQRVVGSLVLLLGLIIFTYPFSYEVLFVATWGYVINGTIGLAVGLGTMGLHMQNLNTTLQEKNRQIRQEHDYLFQIFDSMNQYILVCSPDYRLEFLNRAARNLYGDSKGEICYEQMGKNSPCARCPISNILQQDSSESISYVIENQDLILKGSATRLTNLDGSVSVLEVLEDVTEHKQAEQKLIASENRYKAVVEDQTEMICRFRADGVLTFVNQAYCRYFNKEPEELLGRPFTSLIPPEDQVIVNKHHAMISPDNPVVEYEHRVMLPDETIRWQHWVDRAFYDQQGNIKEFQAVGRDITEFKQTERQLRESEERNRAVLSAFPDIMFIFDRQGIYLDYYTSDIDSLAAPPEQLMGKSIREVLPLEIAEQSLQCFERAVETGQPQQIEYTLEVLSGLKHFEARITPMGEYRLLAIVRDITDRKKAEETLREQQSLQELLMNLANYFINIPLENVDQAINEMLEDIGKFTKVDRAYITNHDYNRQVTGITHEWYAEGITPLINSQQDVPFDHVREIIEIHRQGEIVHIPAVADMPDKKIIHAYFEARGIKSLILLPLFYEGRNIGYVGLDTVIEKKHFTKGEIDLLKVFAEITSNALARQKNEIKIHYMSYHDKLTGLYNRTFLEEKMASLNTEEQLPLAVIMADLNGLKLVNDTYSHATGDELLKCAADILRKSFRAEDIIARWGGDEFVVLLPQTTEKTARSMCKRIINLCRNAYVEDVPVSMALGIAARSSITMNPAEILKLAEDNMYKQKLTENRSTKSAILRALLKTLQEKSYETETHTRGMQKIAQDIGNRIELPDSELNRLDLLITLHDIGKINISEEILTKSGSLTAEEWEVIKEHPEIGFRIARTTEEFAHVAEDILAHHERWDGAGYPQGLKEKEIPMLARITAIADALEVMTNGRPYKKALSADEVITEFKRCAGTQFDPELVLVLVSIIETDRDYMR